MFNNITFYIPSLIKHVEILEAQKEQIAKHWVEDRWVLEVMKKHDIEVEFFKREYALKVLEYFFSVVKQEQQVGVCPVIDKLLIYLKEKDVSADELFVICANARKAMIYETFLQKIASYRLISDISLLFDMNFSGVLKQYANTIYRLEKLVNEELQKNREKDILLFQQSRLAKMGEMISMIAHQWRQPLGAIAANSIDLKMQSELALFNLKKEESAKEYQKYINNGLDEIDRLVQNLTNTIDDFRNFNNPAKESVFITLEEVCSKAINITKASLSNDGIEMIYDYSQSNKKFKLYDSEIAQVILNLIQNSQDNFKEKKIKNPRIKITTDENGIIFCDNGGGIKENIITNIFDPYFSTKDEKNGTGLGLYLSKTIIEDHHHGSLKVENREDGVCFIITLDIKK